MKWLAGLFLGIMLTICGLAGYRALSTASPSSFIGIAVDGSGNVFTAQGAGRAVVEFSAASNYAARPAILR
jgi:hypothetical protein